MYLCLIFLGQEIISILTFVVANDNSNLEIYVARVNIASKYTRLSFIMGHGSFGEDYAVK